MSFTEKKRSVAGNDVAYRDWGKPEAPIIFAIHGWLDNAASFDDLCQELSGFRIIAIDLPGHGYSDHLPGEMAYHFLAMVSLCLDFCEEITKERAFLLGHSLGGAIASFMAACRSERFIKFVGIEGLGPIPAKDGDLYERTHRYLDQREALLKAPPKVYTQIDDLLRAKQIANPMPEVAARRILERNLKKEKNTYLWRSDPRWTLRSPVRLSEPQILNVLERLTTPSLIIEADHERLKKFCNIDERMRVVPTIKRVEIAGSHHIHCERPQEVARAIQKFYRE